MLKSIALSNASHCMLVSGYGIYVNSSSGMAHINDCTILENEADGIKYVHHDERLDDRLDRADVFDLCTLPTTASQTFPVTISMEQNEYTYNAKRCSQVSVVFVKSYFRTCVAFAWNVINDYAKK